jgi:cytochrome P450
LLARLDGEVDVAGHFARPLVLGLLDEVLGLSDPADDSDRGPDGTELAWWHEAALAMEGRGADTAAIAGRVRSLLERRRTDSPRGVFAALGAGGLPDDVAIATAFFAFDAGYVNTVNFLGLALLALARFPDQYQWLRAHPHAVPGAVDELLRFAEPPARASMRVAAQDVQVGVLEIAAGTTVWISRARANRDPARFPGGERLDLARPAAGSLAFGAGPHYCLGAGLVRAVADLTLLALLDRVEELAPTPRTPATWDFADPLPLAVRPLRPTMSD